MKLKVAMAVLGVLIAAPTFVYVNISQDYPMDQACGQLRASSLRQGHPPAPQDLDALGLPRVKLFSTRHYEVKNGGFLFYFCPTQLGPCEVCTDREGPYVDEI